MTLWLVLVAGLLLETTPAAAQRTALVPGKPAGAALADFRTAVAPFVEGYCVKCHGAEKQKGKVALHTLRGEPLQDSQIELWKAVLEQLENGEMPPEDARQPSTEQRKQVQQWIKTALSNAGESLNEGKMLDPSKGNWVDHDALFSGKATAATVTPARLWRLTGQAYEEFIQQKNLQFKLGIRDYGESRITAPWNFTPQWNFNDYASSHRVGEAEIEYHMRNATQVAQAMVKKFAGRNPSFGDWLKELNVVIKAGSATTAEQVKEATLASFKSILGREPSAKELDRSSGFLAAGLKSLPAEKAVEQFLITILFQPEVMYRLEIPSGGARQMLEPRALARAIAFALTDLGPDEALRKAVADGKLTTREQAREHVARVLADPAIGKPRILRFFQEYFGYTSAPAVFKDEVTLKAAGLQKSSSNQWHPFFFVWDADNLIRWVLKADKNVLYELLTTTKTFAVTGDPKVRDKAAEAVKKYVDKPFQEHAQVALKVYELTITRQEWSDERPFDMPAGHRMGILTHPAWLVAQSGNFDNHAIHRGRWIREKLLGGKIPEVPITVNAMLPDEPHKSLRERMRVTREEYCWKCHQTIDPLGMPFEQFDHFGRFRTEEQVVDKEATEKNVDKNGRSRGTKYTAVKLDTTGSVGRSGDPKLDGPVKDPFEMIQKLAASERVQQVFVRHAFRYFIGRNETVEDGPVLVEAHRAYVKNGGSMNALITSLLTSDAFLYRAPRAPSPNP
jgi:mono/diheme cytochrome c family protein